MQRVFVLDKNKQALMPTSPARARKLLKKGMAAIFRRYPFTIILLDREGGEKQPLAFKVDPGSRTTGMVLVADFLRGKRVIWAAELTHRGQQIKKALLSRRQLRRGRRGRKTRYRKPRFDNRTRPKGWLPPSLQSRVDNVTIWLSRLRRFCPITSISQELVRFDMQLMGNAEISGVAYQQGDLYGYEVREYLLEKWGRKCAYCGVENVPLEIEHIVPKSRGGSNRVSNLTIACNPCNVAKNSQTAAEFGHPGIQAKAKKPLKDAAAVNATRWTLWRELEATRLPVEAGTGGQTKFNRRKQNYPKTHWLDAACVGRSGSDVFIHPKLKPLLIKSVGRGSRQMCRMDKFGFPRTKPKQFKRVHGFQTGDIVKAIVPNGKKAGTHIGRAAVRAKGSFRIGTVDGINWKYCQMLQPVDGYDYLMLDQPTEVGGLPSAVFSSQG
jgi:5-methylcytosine-specific restriction endonuclease McrA